MKISELAAATDVPVATLKYYLREGLLPAGQCSRAPVPPTAATTSSGSG
ncbi:MerR family DNA-binding transcriptional regulator [Janibacter limosus]|uniref:MerR family DNA-binding transcriptional regulator n=1 Tax=Janibacter limosus TaxID=53458 RepID=A0AC61U4B2_9MICO|nr:MerR family DNA-binding transcriptional regulator [Janibacter limosus]UUZ44890.1 MerR family DNA-binding transcriptional regulator [Janibacter limosus]